MLDVQPRFITILMAQNKMEELEGLDAILTELIELGYHASAIAIVKKNVTNYLGWYKLDAFLDDHEHLEHIGVMVRGISDSQPEPRERLQFGEPNSHIVAFGDYQFRHLNLEERARFQAGFCNPQDHIVPKHRFRNLDGKRIH